MIEWPPCVLPRAIEEALDSAHEISELINEHHPASYEMLVPGGEIAGVMYAIALDHRAATLLLISRNARSAAFALARSVFEAYLRGMWAQHCATERDVEKVFEHYRMPTVDTMVKRLDKVKDLRKSIGDQKRIVWEPLSDYAHAGPRQLFRWIGDDGIEPQHSDAELLDLLFHTNIIGLAACVGVADLAGTDGAVYNQKAVEVLAAARERRSMGGA